MNIEKLLKEYPELWALHQDWLTPPDIKVFRAPQIGLLAKETQPSNSIARIDAIYLATSPPLVLERMRENYKGEPLIEEQTRARDLRACLYVTIRFRGRNIRYFFFCEKIPGEREKIWRIIIVKPPRGKKNFAGYKG